MRTIGQDVYCVIYDGGPQGPSGPSWGSPLNVKPKLLDVKDGNKVTTTPVRSLGDGANYKRAQYVDGDVSIEMLVAHTGPVDITFGNYIKVILAAHSSMSSPEEHIGLLTGDDRDYPDGPTKQTLTIEKYAE